MSRGPGNVIVVTEVGYCNFCGRPRNLRREERHLGEMVRTTVTCESCHRTLFSTMGVAAAPGESAAPPQAEPAAAQSAAAAEPAPPAAPKPKAAAVRAKAAQAKARPAPRRAAKGR